MSFVETVLQENADLCAAIRAMPFNRALADGTLPAEVFQNYIIQDAHYLEGFARALALAASAAPDADAVAQLAGSRAGALHVERDLHAHYMGLFGVTAADFNTTPPTPACDHYTSFLISTAATGTTGEAVAALLPCFWVYRDVGHDIHARAAGDNPYRAWIDTYVSDDFDAAVTRSCGLADRLYAQASDTVRGQMRAAFAKSTLMEWAFWDSAWHLRGWPTPDPTGIAA